MLEVKELLNEMEERMEMSVMHLEDTLAKIRAGRANIHILDNVRIDYYGQMSPLNVAANITRPMRALSPYVRSIRPCSR